MKALVTVVVTAGAVLVLTDVGSAYKAYGQRWSPGTVTMHLQQGSSNGTLIDGSTNWDAVTDGALTTWNAFLNGVTLRGQRGSTVAIGNPNGLNNVIFDDDKFGEPFGAETVAVAMYWYRGDRFTEGDVVFNTKFSWNSYRGNLRSASGGGTLHDLRRVALHEFGHILGLDHPDQHGQSVSALMNSRISNTDSLQSDDTNGVQSIYGTVTAAPAVTDTLSAGGRLTAGQTLVSTNRRYRLLYQNDGNLVLYDDTDRTAPWATNTGGTTPGYALLQGDGNFVLYDGAGAVQYASNTPGNPNSRLVLQNDGNVVIYASNGQPVWDRNR
ncbi:MAG: matrixin family metalloprotease [Acidimicrobiia bacterium]|nr:matrixin family metalloprotease [Acidimicrobiia bacterium]